jgi:hypothetical protein
MPPSALLSAWGNTHWFHSLARSLGGVSSSCLLYAWQASAHRSRAALNSGSPPKKTVSDMIDGGKEKARTRSRYEETRESVREWSKAGRAAHLYMHDAIGNGGSKMNLAVPITSASTRVSPSIHIHLLATAEGTTLEAAASSTIPPGRANEDTGIHPAADFTALAAGCI